MFTTSKKISLPYQSSSNNTEAFLKISPTIRLWMKDSLPAQFPMNIDIDEKNLLILLSGSGFKLKAQFLPKELEISYEISFALKLWENKIINIIQKKLVDLL